MQRIILFLLFSGIPFMVLSQNNRIHIGLALPFSIKYNVFVHNQTRLSPFFSTGLQVVARVDGDVPGALSFQLSAGPAYDQEKFKPDENNSFTLEQLAVTVHPQIIIPSRRPALKFVYGIGIAALLHTTPSYQSSDQNTQFHIDMDAAEKKVAEHVRKVIPFVSFGILYDISTHFSLDLSVTQHLLNHYKDAGIDYRMNATESSFSIGYLPSAIGLTVICYF